MEVLGAAAALFTAKLSRSILSNGLFVAVVYLLFWKLWEARLVNWRIQEKSRADRNQRRTGIENGLIVFAVRAAILAVALTLGFDLEGSAAIYLTADEYLLAWIPLSLILLILIDDAWFYGSPRLLHHPVVYRSRDAFPSVVGVEKR